MGLKRLPKLAGKHRFKSITRWWESEYAILASNHPERGLELLK